MVNMLTFILLGFLMLGLRAQDSVTVCNGGDECCDGITCGLGEGDCDSHENCVGHLRCGNDNCVGTGFDSTDDCCYEDPDFPRPTPKEDIEKCEIAEDLEKKIAQAAVAQGCDLPKGRPESLSLNECAQVSCSADLIGKSFTCNNQNKERTCKELLSLLDAMVIKRTSQCKNMLRSGYTHLNHLNQKLWACTSCPEELDLYKNTCNRRGPIRPAEAFKSFDIANCQFNSNSKEILIRYDVAVAPPCPCVETNVNEIGEERCIRRETPCPLPPRVEPPAEFKQWILYGMESAKLSSSDCYVTTCQDVTPGTGDCQTCLQHNMPQGIGCEYLFKKCKDVLEQLDQCTMTGQDRVGQICPDDLGVYGYLPTVCDGNCYGLIPIADQ